MRKTGLAVLIITVIAGIISAGSADAREGVLEAWVEITDGDTVYQFNTSPPEPVNVKVTVTNESGDELITKAGFSGQPFHLQLVFTDQDNKEITSLESGAYFSAPTPDMLPEDLDNDGRYDQVQAIERLPAGWFTATQPFNVYEYNYPLRPGKYMLSARIHARIIGSDNTFEYPSGSGTWYANIKPGPNDWAGILWSTSVPICIYTDSDGDGSVYPACLPSQQEDCDDSNANVHPGAAEIPDNGIDDDCDGVTDFPPPPAAGARLNIQVDRHVVGSGSHPGSEKFPLGNVQIRVFDKSEGSCVKTRYGVSWQNYRNIWNYCRDIWDNLKFIQTDSSGLAGIDAPPGEYMLLGEYKPEGADRIYIGRNTGIIEPGVTVSEYLQIIEKVDGKQTPAKYTKKTGSELLIIEPEYVEWDGTQELYPFVFESIGDWSVTTAVSPPEGFVTDNNSLSEEVNTEVEAVQFTITDVGSKWVDTEVTHDIGHKGKKEKVRSKIGIKCSKNLAKKKGFDAFCNKVKNNK